MILNWKVITKIKVIILILIFNSCSGICENKILTISFSPNKEYKAIAFIRTCGATTSFSPQVSILKKNEKFSNKKKGNVFIGNNSNNINIYWENNSCLIILPDTIDNNF
ncbi:MAG: DUF5412 family protein [Treponema sp.]|nr:DUF5412 family protein [Treponema sp.]